MLTPSNRVLRPALAGSVFLVLAACSSKKNSGLTPPPFRTNDFSSSAAVTHSFFPLVPGTNHVFSSQKEDGQETTVVEVLSSTRTVLGIACAVVRDRVFSGGLLREDTHDFYAQDRVGNVWYMGEEVDNYDYDDQGNLLGINHDGAWEAGRDVAGIRVVARAGHIMPAMPRVGAKYYQEFYRGHAEDTGEIVALDAPITLSDGTTYRCLKIKDATRLAPGEEFKYFAPGVGKVFEEEIGTPYSGELLARFRPGTPSIPSFTAATFSNPTAITHPALGFQTDTTKVLFLDSDEPEAIVIERVDAMKTVMGVACAVIRDRVFLGGLLHEDTIDWYAQDDAGNVWYMGEEVDNYHYDENGNVVEITHEGAWEAGLDVANTGSVARPGFYLQANPVAGASYHQEYYAGEATDMARVVATGVTVELADGRSFEDCVQTLDWNPLDPGGLEHKFFAPGNGVVREDVLHDDEAVHHIGTYQTGAAAVPDFAAATFTMPTTVDHPAFPLPPGANWSYRKQTDEGLEEITVTVQAATRTVLNVVCLEALYEKLVDGRIKEVARDWYAQDDAGNVWYTGEEVDNYNYDANGNLVNITHEGSWEAGRDVANVGQIAQAGFIMPAMPAVGASCYQEYYPTEAEDMGFVVATDVTVESGGRSFAGCVQVLDWTAIEPDALEYKFYAPGIGLVLEHGVGSDERNELVGSSLLR